MTTLQDLLERLENAEGPDRELDGMIWRVCFPGGVIYDESVECPTASLDAAIALTEAVLPGWGINVFFDKETIVAHVVNPIGGEQHRAFGAAPALALIAATLKALIAKETN